MEWGHLTHRATKRRSMDRDMRSSLFVMYTRLMSANNNGYGWVQKTNSTPTDLHGEFHRAIYERSN